MNTPRRHTAQSLTPVSQLVRPIVKELLPKNAVMLRQLFEAWHDLMKGTEAEGSIPEKLVFPKGQQSKGKLNISTLTSGQAMEIQFGQSTLLQRINSFFGCQAVSEIRVTAYPTTCRSESPVTVSTKNQSSCQSLDKDLSGISNPVLRARLAELGALLETTHNKGDEHA